MVNNAVINGFRNRLLGQALVPIAFLLPTLNQASELIESEDGVVLRPFRTTLELELFPVPKDATKFQQVLCTVATAASACNATHSRLERGCGVCVAELAPTLRRGLVFCAASALGRAGERARW